MDYTPRRKLTREFKLEAVRQVALSEKPKTQLARELGVRVGQLRTCDHSATVSTRPVADAARAPATPVNL